MCLFPEVNGFRAVNGTVRLRVLELLKESCSSLTAPTSAWALRSLFPYKWYEELRGRNGKNRESTRQENMEDSNKKIKDVMKS